MDVLPSDNGNRRPPNRIEGRLSRDGGRSWLPDLLTFSGQLYGYDIQERPRSGDLGYPSSVVRASTTGGGRGITMYYWNPSIRTPPRLQDGIYLREGEPRFEARDYRAVAVLWDESELIAALRSAY